VGEFGQFHREIHKNKFKKIRFGGLQFFIPGDLLDIAPAATQAAL
jgi:hypothetical protein